MRAGDRFVVDGKPEPVLYDHLGREIPHVRELDIAGAIEAQMRQMDYIAHRMNPPTPPKYRRPTGLVDQHGNPIYLEGR